MRHRGITGALVAMLAAAGCTELPCEARVGDLCPLVGSGELGFNRDGLAPEDTDLFLVSAARRGPDGRLYVMDFNNQRLRRIGDAGTMETVIGSGFHAIADVDAPLLDTPLENPFDFGFFADGRVVFVSYHDPRVLTVGADGTLEVVAGAGDGVVGMLGDEGDGGPATAALFMQLDGIAVAPDDTVYVSDSLANRVRRIRQGIITTVAGTGETGLHGDGGPATSATLHWPGALELDAEGNLYIVDTFNHAIRRLAVDGTISTLVGTGTEGAGGDGGPATAAQLSQPFGLTRAADGTLYIGDRGNFKIRRVDVDGVIDTIVGTGATGATGDDGPASAATLGYTARLALDSDADGEGLLIVDQSNSRVRRLTLR